MSLLACALYEMSDYKYVKPNTVVNVVAIPLLFAFFFLSISLLGLSRDAPNVHQLLNYSVGLMLVLVAVAIPFLSRGLVNRRDSRLITRFLWRIGIPLVFIPITLMLVVLFVLLAVDPKSLANT